MKKYDFKKLGTAVKKYKKQLGNIKGKDIFIKLDVNDKKAFYSLAPLSQAIDELGGDLNVQVVNKKIGKQGKLLGDFFECIYEMNNNINTKAAKALKDFLKVADKKCQGKLKKIFSVPDIELIATKNGFKGDIDIGYEVSWMKEYKANELLKTAKVIWNQVYNLKKSEKVTVGFELLRKQKDLGLPLEDYLDSFQISYAMMKAIQKQVLGMGAHSSRKSQLDAPNKIAEMKTIIMGCELCKDSTEPVFKKYKILSKLLKLDRNNIPSATFFISGKGYPGRHYFGEFIGYPSKNKKTRWMTPGMMIYKLDHFPQTALDSSKPKARVGFTETLPIDVFIKTNKIDWLEMKRKDDEIINIAKKCEYFIVEGKKFGKYQTKLKVGLVGKKGRREFRNSDVETRNLINPKLKKKGILAGTMSNIPGGEAFVTPENLTGTFIGDVVISLDQSYMLNARKPMIVKCMGNKYKVIDGPAMILKKFKDKKDEGLKKLKIQEKNRSMPKKLIDINKKNFLNIGEFAINTNPKAELCDYLIVNEKIKNMIHIALGSGFDPDRATVYHTDIVIDSPRQELDIYGVDKKGKKYWIHKKGKFVI